MTRAAKSRSCPAGGSGINACVMQNGGARLDIFGGLRPLGMSYKKRAGQLPQRSVKTAPADDAADRSARSVVEGVIENATACPSENLSVVPSEPAAVQVKPSCCPALFPVRCCPHSSEPRSGSVAPA